MLMKMIADLHIHSRFSMATSKEGTPENLDFWARKKGISLIGTGDFTHPVWREELKERLVSEGNGLYRLRDEYVKEESRKFPGEGTRFVVSGEISSIYKKNGKTRKVHNVILLPGLEAQMPWHSVWKKSEIFTQMVVRFLVWTVMIFWK